MTDAASQVESTSAAGPMDHLFEWARVGVTVLGLGTASAYALPAEAWAHMPLPVEQTTSGTPIQQPVPAGPAVAEVRRLTGFTWDQLTKLFGVSRRSLHFWASGKPMAAENEEHLRRTLAVLRTIDRGTAHENRAALLDARNDGRVLLDLLAARQYDQVTAVLGNGPGRRAAPQPSRELLAARAPLPPHVLVDALQDRVHPASGRLLGVRPVRAARRK